MKQARNFFDAAKVSHSVILYRYQIAPRSKVFLATEAIAIPYNTCWPLILVDRNENYPKVDGVNWLAPIEVEI